MRIAIYCSPGHSVPPKERKILAPWWLAAQLANGLVKRGHKVTLFAAKESRTKAKLISLGIKSLWQKRREFANRDEYRSWLLFWEQRLAAEMYFQAKQGKFDIIHSHLTEKLLAMASLVKTPSLFTIHNPFTDKLKKKLMTYKNYGQISFAGISRSHRKDGGDLSFSGVVYNGVDIKKFKFSGKPGKYLLWCGRVTEEKGVREAIEAGLRTGIKTIITGEIFKKDRQAREYWEKEIEPLIDPSDRRTSWKVKYLRVLSRKRLVELYQGALALLFPIKWHEPFGLVMIEAMACGTAVIAYDRGSVREVVKDGETGYIINPKSEIRNSKQAPNSPGCDGASPACDGASKFQIQKPGVEGLTEAIKRIGEIDRRACRRHVEENFTVEKMVEGYIKIYQKLKTKN